MGYANYLCTFLLFLSSLQLPIASQPPTYPSALVSLTSSAVFYFPGGSTQGGVVNGNVTFGPDRYNHPSRATCFSAMSNLVFSNLPLPSGSSARTITVFYKSTQSKDRANPQSIVRYGGPGCYKQFAITPYYCDSISDGFCPYGTNSCQDIGASASPKLNDGKWHMLAFTYDGGTGALYVDGNQVAVKGLYVSTDAFADLVLAWQGEETSPGFVGCLSEVLIFDFSLSIEQIQTLSRSSLATTLLLAVENINASEIPYDIKKFNVISGSITSLTFQSKYYISGLAMEGEDYIVVRSGGSREQSQCVDDDDQCASSSSSMNASGSNSHSGAITRSFSSSSSSSSSSSLSSWVGLDFPTSVAVDAKGNIYTSDINNHPSSNDNNNDNDNNTRSISVDAFGNVYIIQSSPDATASNNTDTTIMMQIDAATGEVRRLKSSSVNNTTTPSNTSSYHITPSGIAVDRVHNIVYVSDSENNAIYAFNPLTNEMTLVLATGVENPSALAVAVNVARNSGGGGGGDATSSVFLYICDVGSHTIKKYNVQTREVSTLVTHQLLSIYSGLAVDTKGEHVFFSTSVDDRHNMQILQFNEVTGEVVILVSKAIEGGSGSTRPWSLAVDTTRDKSLYYVESSRNTLWKYDLEPKVESMVVRNLLVESLSLPSV